MEKIPACLALLLFALCTPAQTREGLAMRCTVPPAKPAPADELVRPKSMQENERFRSAPHGVRRIGSHQLEVTWTGGKKVFTDKAPYNEPHDGIWWSYCGYEPKLGLHLLLKQDNYVFTGKLLDDRSGDVLPGGHVVLFSPDMKYYLAYEQPDGQDGETIRLHTRNGTLLWKGFNGILSPDGITLVADFERMEWDLQNRPRASGRLENGKTFTVTLTQGSNGKWEWLPHVDR
jgi:hypothetical protein